MGNSSFEPVEALSREGRFQDALVLLTSDVRRFGSVDAALCDAFEAELSYETGKETIAIETCRRGLARQPATAETARFYRVLALCAFNAGDLPSTKEYLNNAFEACQGGSRLRAILELTRFGLGLALEPLEASSAALPGLKRIVVNTGDPHLLCLLRIYVARLEVRRTGPTEALRHHEAVLSILERYPNVWLRGLVEIDSSIVLMLMGEVELAIRAAETASRFADESGHFNTKIGADVNLSHMFERTGEFDRAKRHIDRAVKSAGDNRHLARAVRDSWANLLITSGDFEAARRVFAEAARGAKVDGECRPHWDAITESFSLARLYQAENSWNQATEELSQALSCARHFDDSGWRKRILINLARCKAIAGDYRGALDNLVAAGDPGSEPHMVAEHFAARAALRFKNQNLRSAVSCLQQATRIARATSNTGLSADIMRGLPSLDQFSQNEASPSLDSAVALLELAGHPHILGPEAFALIQGAACADAVALIAASPAGTRIVQCAGWSESQASAAAAVAGDGTEHLPIGRRAEETWTLVVQPKREIEPYCTFASIRKLLTVALSLDGYRRDEKQRAALWPAEALDSDPECIWASEQMSETLTIARRIAPTPLSVLVTGETGTGKEMLARTIHRASDRADKVFLPFNCTAVPRDMLESQLFGYRKGAFTGADASFPGVIRSAAGGTLFLDEIGEIGPEIQPKLLRFLETHEIHPLGEPHPIKVDVRVVAATNASVEQLVAEGRFREDLFYRLNVVRLSLPPLRERREEIPPLVHHYLRKYGDEQRKGRLTLGDETLEYLLLFSWPGNVRQLANEVRRMVALAEPDAPITPALLSPEIQASRRTMPAITPTEIEARVALDQPLPVAVEMLEQMMVRRALDRTHGRVEEASRLLGISRKGLFLKRRRWGLSQVS